jgi:chemotaxis regulatin CheY-phosphate phosphatase CheZ
MVTTNDRYFNSATPGITSRMPRSGFWWPFCLDEIDPECAQLIAQLANRIDHARSDQQYALRVIRDREEAARMAGMPLHMRSVERISPHTHRLEWPWVEDTERWIHAIRVQLAETEIEQLVTLIEAAYVA